MNFSTSTAVYLVSDSDYSMVIRFFTLFTPFMSLTILVTRFFSAGFLALPPTVVSCASSRRW